MRLVGAQTATLVSSFTPIIPFMWAWWKGQILTGAEILGVAITIAAIVAHNLNEKRRAATAEPA